MFEENAAALRRMRRDMVYEDVQQARIVGAYGSTGQLIVELSNGRGQIIVVNAGVNATRVGAPVLIGARTTDGTMCAFDGNFDAQSVATHGENLVSVVVPPVSGVLDVTVKDGKLLKPGRVRPSTNIPDTLYVYIEPFWHNGAYLGNVDHDLGAANVPTTALQHRWCAVVVAPDNTTQTIAGTAQTYTSKENMIVSDAEEIVVPPGMIVVGYVTLSHGQTAASQSRFEDARDWLGARGRMLSEAPVQVSINGGVANSGGASFVTLKAETGNQDDLDTLSVTGVQRIVVLQAVSGDAISVKNAVGNIYLNGDRDFVLSDDKTLALFWDGVNFSDFGAGASVTAADVGIARITERIIYSETLSALGQWDVQNSNLPPGVSFSDFDDLEIRIYNARTNISANSQAFHLLFNNDTTAANYSSAEGFEGSSSGGSRTDAPIIGFSSGANALSGYNTNGIISVPSPGSSDHKTAYSEVWNRYNATNHFVLRYAVQWENTDAITRITIRTANHPTNQFTAGSKLVIIGRRLEIVGGVGYSSANVANPPTLANLNAAFGTPSAVGAGFTAVLNDDGAGTHVYMVASDGANWWYTSMTKAV